MEELPPTNADFVITQSTENGLSAIEKQNIDDIVSMALQKQADLYNRKMQLLEETIQNLQMEQEPKKHIPKSKPKPKDQSQPSTPQVVVKNMKNTQINKRAQSVAKGAKTLNSHRAHSEPLPSPRTSKPNTPSKISVSKGKTMTPAKKTKKHQLTTGEFSPNFRSVKNLVPEAVAPQVLKCFQARFSSIDEFEAHAANPNANVFVADADIEALNAGRAGRVNISQEMLQSEESDLRYIHGYLGKLGIECWGPNLEESSDSLWNSACRTSAINLFRQMAASGAYRNTSLNHGKEFAEKTLKSYGLDEEEVNSEGDDVDEQDEEIFEDGVIDLEAPSDCDKDLEYVKDGEWSCLYDEDEDYVQSSEEQSETEEDEEEFADEMGAEKRMEE
ncbi:hypothetical protein O181_072584 [Austropuccinia psidii MF-1]|uniref:Uncharacterized protein n=1 Tax=Austropuccinia psidii MF-1 TaxID=1389203 RepID=A0A9Q3IBM7_9BASI|nr:hypothetical protein [Austropuccinia psidii MF-1]